MRYCVIIFISFLFVRIGHAQDLSNLKTLNVQLLGDTIQLDSLSISPNSEKVFAKDGSILSSDNYQIDYAIPQQENYYTDQFNLGRVRIVKQIPPGAKINYENVQIKIAFEIKGAGNFVFKAHNKKVLQRINKSFPRLLNDFR